MDKTASAPMPLDSPLEVAVPPLPDWLAPALPDGMTLAQLKRHNEQTLFENCYSSLLDHVAKGNPLSAAIERDPREIDYTRLMAWINRDEGRKARYREAQEIGAEAVADQMISIADADDTVEDVQRSTLRINTRKWLLGVWNRKRFGDTKQIEQTVTIDLTSAIADAQARVDASRTIDVQARIS